MEQIPEKRSKPRKYLVLSIRQLDILKRMAIEFSDEHDLDQGNQCVVMELEHADKRYAGQLRYTDEFRYKTYDFWPEEEVELESCHCDNCVVGCNPREWCLIKGDE